MTIDELLSRVRDLDSVLVLEPGPDSTAPEIAWGDKFFYYAPDGEVPTNVQPFGTIVTKDYPDDTASALDGPGRWRLNIHVDTDTFVRLVGEEPRALGWTRDYAAPDIVNPHPVYGPLGWLSIVTPESKAELALDLLRAGHEAARERYQRRANL
jgi:hypothetical protein